jgi:hypothetical protein
MKCQECSRTVTRKSKFCAHCGSPVVFRSSPKKQSKQKLQPVYIISLLIVGAMVGYGISKIGSKNQDVSSISTFDGSGSNGALSSQVFEISKAFNCPCGTCEHSLESCSCEHPNGAVEIKNFIAQQLNQTHKKPHIIEMVQAKYGGLKSKTEPAFQFNPPTN